MIILICIFAALIFADGYFTYEVIRKGKGKEGNPVIAKLIKLIGPIPALLVTRLAALGLAIYEPKITYFLIPIWCWVVWRNYNVLYSRT